MRILVLTSSTGGGHDARAHAFRAWIRKSFGEAAEVKIEKVLENSSLLTRFGVELYNRIQQNAPWLHNIYWWIVEGFGYLNDRLRFFGNGYFKKLLARFQPHVIISFHGSTNRGLFRTARSVLKEEPLLCVTYCGEFSGGAGYSRNWADPEVDLFLARTEEARRYAITLGIPENRTKILRNFLRPEVFENLMEREERKLFRKEKLGLIPGRFTVLLATGRFGANNHLEFLERLVKKPEKIQAIVICGKNEAVFKRLNGWRRDHPEFSLYLESFSQQVHNLIQASDCMVTRGGANTSAEGLFYGCPLIFTSFGGTMPQERLTLKYFLNHEAAVLVKDEFEFEDVIFDWMDFSKRYQFFRNHLRSLQTADSPQLLIEEIGAWWRRRGGVGERGWSGGSAD